MWVIIWGISSSPLKGLRLGGSGWVGPLWLGMVQKSGSTPSLPHYHLLEESGVLETWPLGREPSAAAEPGSSQDVFGEGL